MPSYKEKVRQLNRLETRPSSKMPSSSGKNRPKSWRFLFQKTRFQLSFIECASSKRPS